MKKFLFKSIGVLLAVILIISQTQAISARTIDFGLPGIDESAFVLDQDALNSAMQELNELESYLEQNEGVTYQDLVASESSLILNVSESSFPMGMGGDYDDILGIPPFFWGCVLGWIGVLLVYLMSEDKGFVKKAVIGALVSTGVAIIIYILAFASAANGINDLN